MDSNENLSERVAEEIRALLARRRVTGRELARRLSVSSPWVSQRLTGHTEISLGELERIADALGVDWIELLPKPAYRDERGQSSSRRNTYGKPEQAERTMRSARVATAGCTHAGGSHAAADSSGNQARRPVIKSWRDGQVTAQ